MLVLRLYPVSLYFLSFHTFIQFFSNTENEKKRNVCSVRDCVSNVKPLRASRQFVIKLIQIQHPGCLRKAYRDAIYHLDDSWVREIFLVSFLQDVSASGRAGRLIIQQ